MTKRKKNIFIIQIFIFLFTLLLLYITYKDKGVEVEIIEESLKTETSNLNTNIFEDVEYKGIDLNGNRYLVKSKSAEFDLESPEIINMTVMNATFYFKDGTVLTVDSDNGVYNNKTLDMKFRDNIKARTSAASLAETIIEQEGQKWSKQYRALAAVDTIRAFRSSIESIRDAEIEKALTALDRGQDSEDIINMLARNLTNKLLHKPTTRLKKTM